MEISRFRDRAEAGRYLADLLSDYDGREPPQLDGKTVIHAVGLWYDDFSQTSDEEVRELLVRAAGHATSSA
jgi:predicted phosphoribosyltransferase